MVARKRLQENTTFIFLLALAVIYLLPILIVLMNSFKGRFFIADAPFDLPTAQPFSGIKNYISGIEKTGFLPAFG